MNINEILNLLNEYSCVQNVSVVGGLGGATQERLIESGGEEKEDAIKRHDWGAAARR